MPQGTQCQQGFSTKPDQALAVTHTVPNTAGKLVLGIHAGRPLSMQTGTRSFAPKYWHTNCPAYDVRARLGHVRPMSHDLTCVSSCRTWSSSLASKPSTKKMRSTSKCPRTQVRRPQDPPTCTRTCSPVSSVKYCAEVHAREHVAVVSVATSAS